MQVRAVILAGGFGTRARPLTANRPKPMLPLGNRPLLEHTVRALVRSGFDDLVFLLHHQPEVIRRYFQDGAPWGCRITYLQPERDLGTAGATALARHLLGRETFLVASADVVTDFDLTRALAFHRQRAALATILLSRVADTSPFGVVQTSDTGRVRHFTEKPSPGETCTDTVNAGYYLLQPQVLDLVPPEEPWDFSQDLFPRLLEERAPLYAMAPGGYWRDVGDPVAYLAAHQDLWRGRVELELPDPWRPGTRVVWGEGTVVSPQARLEGTVVLGRGVRVMAGAQLTDCVLGDGCSVGPQARLRETVAWEWTEIGAGCRLEGCVLGAAVHLGERVRIMPGAVLADGCNLGQRALVRRHVRIWPDRQVEERAVVSYSLVGEAVSRRHLLSGSAVRGNPAVDLPPELLVRLGEAWGSLLPLGASVALAGDGSAASQMALGALGAGLSSSGVDGELATSLALPLLRYRIGREGRAGGIFAESVPGEEGQLCLRLFGAGGVELSRGEARRLERTFRQEEYRRADEAHLGRLRQLGPEVEEAYRHSIRRVLPPGRGTLPVVLGCSPGPGGELLHRLLAQRGYAPEVVRTEAEPAAGRLSRILRPDSPDGVGVWIDSAGERLALVDGAGRVYQGPEAVLLMVVLLGGAGRTGEVLVGLQASRAVEKLAAEHGMGVARCRARGPEWRRRLQEERVLLAADPPGACAFPAFAAYPDACFAAAEALALLEAAGRSLRELGQEVPRANVLHTSVFCPPDLRGSVLHLAQRVLSGIRAPEGSEILVDEPGGWALILPDERGSRIDVWAEGRDASLARNLLERYSRKLATWREEMSQGTGAAWGN
jgi:mannose-1-phosphate guanylyltransferase/phosphomannomutase